MKNSKKKNPFKVDQVRSIKMKAKAKQYTGNLKQLKAIVKDKVKSTDDQLSALEDVVRTSQKKDADASNKNKSVDSEKIHNDRKQIIDDYEKSMKTEGDALDKLANWTCKE
ncbi:Hypothetical protein NTJ_05359 [Nesidiocoris tenuis]|uniref:Uncharacterized protein n=1 Tax=Nesidiocoris tenuis TaxID=355587 RepID=A0ABN7ANR9_9HEMI|nr:Hypothetical protein NTJ_05359 [Nesidiocoris tenuis]